MKTKSRNRINITRSILGAPWTKAQYNKMRWGKAVHKRK